MKPLKAKDTALLLSFLLISHVFQESASITNGREVLDDDEQWSMIGALVDSATKNVFCGAILIAQNIAMSAANCFRAEQFENSRLHMKCGDNFGCTSISVGYTIPLDPDYSQVIEIVDIYIHENFIENRTSFYVHNIALLQLAKNVELSQYVRVANLSNKNSNQSFNTAAYIAGWGSMGYSLWDNHSLILQYAEVNAMNQEECQRKLNQKVDWKVCASTQMSTKMSGLKSLIDPIQCELSLSESLEQCESHSTAILLDGQICAMGGSSICQGDGGGPLLDKGTFQVIGIASRSWKCDPGNISQLTTYQWMVSFSISSL